VIRRQKSSMFLLRRAPCSALTPALSSRLLHTPRITSHITLHVRRCSSSVHPKIRNVAVVAHVDHGKTSLVDMLLRSSGTVVSTDRVMDSNALEKERGITILAKSTSLVWKDTLINIVDTPGHADFGGEVERILSMVDGVLLVVDINEGPMAQTKFVVSKAMQAGLRPLLVLNKVDRCDNAQVVSDQVTAQMFDLLHFMGATDHQLDFPIVYTSAKQGWASSSLGEKGTTMAPLLDSILEHVNPPVIHPGPFRMLVTMMEHNLHFGTVMTGRIHSGSVTSNMRVKSLAIDGQLVEEGRVLKVMARRGGMDFVVLDSAGAGDIVTLAGLPKSKVSCTICDPILSEPIPSSPIDPPTISMIFSANSSPIGGREGTVLTSSHIWDRLFKESASNVSIQIRKTVADGMFEVCGRGPLQLGILIETMRREGFELSVSPPRVIMTTDEKGNTLEPVEELVLEIDDEFSGHIIEQISLRKGEMQEYAQLPSGRTRLTYFIPARGLIGFQHTFLQDTRGSGIMHHLYHGNQPFKGEMPRNRRGVLVSTADGATTAYALNMVEERGVLFVGEGEEVYTGMIVGENAKNDDMDVNPVRPKKLTNIRSAGADEKIRLTPPRLMTLEEAIAYVKEDELIEVTPAHIRLRKRQLDSKMRKTELKKKE